MQTESRYTKWKIITGYSIIVLLSLVSAILIYNQITRLIVTETNLSNANQKFFIIGNTMTSLYEAEALSSAFAQTGNQNYFQRFMAAMQETEENIDTLKALSHLPSQQIRIDSISILLEEKIKNLQELVWVKQSFSPEEFYNKAIASIARKDSLQQHPNTRQRTVTRLDTAYVPTQKVVKRWIFSKIVSDTIPQVSLSHQVITDTLDNKNTTQNTDTVVNILKNTWEDVRKQTQDINRKINQKEYALIRQSTNITDQLKRILREYEKEEINNSLYKQQNREKTITTTIRIFAWITVIAILLVIFFTFFILRDLSRSQRYRRELESANQYAAHLLKSREKMILTVTHDIKSPLGSVLGYIELLNNTPINDRQRYFLKNMKGSSEHILKLISNLLDLSKLENNKMPVEEIVFTPARLFREITDNFLPSATEKHLQLTGKFSEDLNQEYKGDALRIRQVITNILSNAVKYTVQGSVLFTATSSADSQQIILTIEDTGSGMTPDEQKMIFEEFTRLKSHAGIEGTGLGLTITLKLIDLLGGQIHLQSEPGKGSCFTISLPLQKVNPTGVAPDTLSGETACFPQNDSNETTPLKILLVDDDPLQLQMTQSLLESKGIHPDVTTHPQEALRLLETKTYDLVFSDIQMPGINGFELVKRIRQLSLPSAKNLPVIALSADSDKQPADYIAGGFTAYLSKPFTSADLFRLIAKFTNRSTPPEQPVIPDSSSELSADTGFTLHNLLIFADHDEETLKKILESFIVSTEEHLRLLQQHLQEKEYDKIARLAHKMLPIFRQLEATDIVKPLERLEHPEKEGLTPEAINDLTTGIIEKTHQLLKLIR